MIPSPPIDSLSVGPLTIHLYALCILAGIVVAVFWSERRWRALGGQPGAILDVAVPAVLLGLVGGRLYHVISDYQLYFLPDSPNEPWEALAIWQGGLGIWGAIPLGALGVWWMARRRGWSVSQLSFAIAPAIPLAQAFGRWGNYFNQELFGGPTTLPWALQVEPGRSGTLPGVETYHPTFLYESLWCLALAGAIALAGRLWTRQLHGGRLFALYVMGYCVGRFFIEYLRVDPANEILGFRLNNWTTLVVFLIALVFFLWRGANPVNESVSIPVNTWSHDGEETEDPSGDGTANAGTDRSDAPDTIDSPDRPGIAVDGDTTDVPSRGDADNGRG